MSNEEDSPPTGDKEGDDPHSPPTGDTPEPVAQSPTIRDRRALILRNSPTGDTENPDPRSPPAGVTEDPLSRSLSLPEIEEEEEESGDETHPLTPKGLQGGGVGGGGMEDGETKVAEEEETEEEGIPRITLGSIPTPRDIINPYLPGLPVVVTITSNTGRQARGLPLFRLNLEHGPFSWTVNKYYRDFLYLRTDLAPLRIVLRRHNRGRGRHGRYLPHLFSFEDINPRRGIRVRNQMPKVQRFMNAVLSDRQFRVHLSTLKFLEVSRVSFVEDLGSKRKEGPITKRSGGHSHVTNCLGCTACCVCRFSFWRQRWFILKDSFVAYIRTDLRTIAGVVLFDEGMVIETSMRNTRLHLGLKISTPSRELLVKCNSQRALREWKEALNAAMATTGKEWVEPKRFNSFAPVRENCSLTWFVDGEDYMSAVANALLAAKDEIFITDWMMSPHVYLQRQDPQALQWRLDQILLKKAEKMRYLQTHIQPVESKGVRVYIQLYKETEVAKIKFLDLGSRHNQQFLNHPNIIIFRHPEHVNTGVYFWAHHEKIVVIDQTLAFVGGIDLCFGRWDNACHHLVDTAKLTVRQKSDAAVSSISHTNSERAAESLCLPKWSGKDYYNPFIKDFIELHDPFRDQLNREEHPRMPWHDIAACLYGHPARDVARHFIQRFNFTKHEQQHGDAVPFLLPRQAFSDEERKEMQYLFDCHKHLPTISNATVQILRSASKWSVGQRTEHSILNAYLHAIENAEHFIYIENQFFISSLSKEDVRNGIAEALRKRIVKAYRQKKVFRVFIVMPLLPSFEGEIGTTGGALLSAVMHWNYRTISRGEDSLIGKLIHADGIPINEIGKFISVCGLRTYELLNGKPITEIVYVHSKCMVVDDRLTIIGSANVNDRSMLGERDSEVAMIVQDHDMVQSVMNEQPYEVGRFSHTLRCRLFKEHLGMLEVQPRKSHPEVSVKDPICDQFYLSTWMRTAEENTEIFEQVFGGKILPTDKALNFQQLKIYRENTGVISRSVEKALMLLEQTQGTLVSMPLRFLEEEVLLPDLRSREYYVPQELLT